MITKHIESQTIIVVDKSGKIIEEFAADSGMNRKVVYDTSKWKRKKYPSGVYEETFKEGLIHGRVKFTWNNGDFY